MTYTRTILLLSAALLLMPGCSLAPQQREARFVAQGKQLLAKKDYKRAALWFRGAIQAMPSDAEPYYQLGLTYLAAGDRPSAISALTKATELNPKHAGAELRLADLWALRGNSSLIADAHKRAQAVVSAFPGNVDALNTLALTELRLGKPEEAMMHLEQALARAPGGLASSALVMRAKLSKGDVKGAEDALLACVRQSPQSADAALVLGRFYLVVHKPSEAEQQFRRAIQIDPHDGRAWMDLGMSLFHGGHNDQAGEVFQRLASLPGKIYKPVYAIFLLETGRRDAAIQEFERLAKEDPNDRTARTRLVKMYLVAGRSREAEKLLAAAIAKNPQDADARLQRSELALEAARYQDAQNDLNQVLRYYPEAAEPHVILARLYAARGQALSQRQELNEAVRLNPDLLPVRLDLARLLVASKAAPTALEILDEAPEPQKHAVTYLVERNWGLLAAGRQDEARQGVAEGLAAVRDPDLLLQDAALKMGDKNYAAARASLEEVLRKKPAEVRALGALVRLYNLENRPAAAVRMVQDHAARHRDSAPIQDFAGEMLLADAKPAEARAAFLAAKAADPAFRPADLALARMDVSEGKAGLARQRLAALLSTHRPDPELWTYMGWLENTDKHYPQAEDYFRKVLDADPRNIVALNNLAYLLASHTGQIDEALRYAQQVKELAPDNKGVDDTIGWVYYHKGLYDSAVKYLESAATGDAEPIVRYHLAMAYLKTGDQRGPAILQEALKKAPDLPEAQMARQLLAQVSAKTN
jgi:putative PEP-CTERM system TPR-repeat lipoprotein